MTIALLSFILLGTLVPCAHTFARMISLSHPTRSPFTPSPSQGRVHMFERSCVASPIAISLMGRRQRRAAGRVLMGSEEVEDFEIDVEVDTEKLEIFGTIITEVKMEGRVPASSHLVYDCSHGEWLLAQMAYDRKIRLFSSRSVRQLGSISSWLPDNSRFIFSGALVPKQIKRLLKMNGLSAVVARDAESVLTMEEAMNAERKRLEAKGLSRISQSRENFLLEKGGGDNGANSKGPVGNLVSGLRTFVRIQDGQSVDEVADIVQTIGHTCRDISVVGLWADDIDPEAGLKMLEAVRTKSGISNLRVAMEHVGPKSAEWFKNTSAPRRGPIMWTFNYEI
ncbi:unnamed protein product [Pylaiella littoralis]